MKWIDNFRSAMGVQRNHTIRTIQQQTVGEHTANAMAMALYLIEQYDIPRVRTRLIMEYLLFHDVAELYVGDIPAPVKIEHPDIKAALDDAEGAWMMNNMPQTPQLTVGEIFVAKAADWLEFMAFCVTEREMGNRLIHPHFHNILNYLVSQFQHDRIIMRLVNHYQERYYAAHSRT